MIMALRTASSKARSLWWRRQLSTGEPSLIEGSQNFATQSYDKPRNQQLRRLTDTSSGRTISEREMIQEFNARARSVQKKVEGLNFKSRFLQRLKPITFKDITYVKHDDEVYFCTVSSLSMGVYFSKQFKDITVAFPFNMHEIQRVNDLLQSGVKLGLTVENEEAVDFLLSSVVSCRPSYHCCVLPTT